jgi:hypothetical protein
MRGAWPGRNPVAEVPKHRHSVDNFDDSTIKPAVLPAEALALTISFILILIRC